MAAPRSLQLSCPPLFLLIVIAGRAAADAMITGTVFCDRCRDGYLSLFDYPLFGAKVAVTCAASDGRLMGYGEQTTTFVGTYGLRLEGIGVGDAGGCFARVVGGSSGCGAEGGPAQALKLLFTMFGTEFYTVDPLLSQPAEPIGYCKSSTPAELYPPPLATLPPPVATPQPPFACPHEAWTEPDYKCHWKVVGPDTTVMAAFGPAAGQKYGTETTLWEGLHGKGDLYRTLLREATTALLNSYSGSIFYFPASTVIDYMNRALAGSPADAMDVALRFRRANSGSPSFWGGACSFSPCS